jgi:hypothetical protein
MNVLYRRTDFFIRKQTSPAMKRFRAIPVCDAQDGMQLYDDVRDRAGNVLLPKLTALTGAMIASLGRRDIDTLLIIDDDITPEQLDAYGLQVQQRIAHLCRHADSGRANARLRDIVEQFRMAQSP